MAMARDRERSVTVLSVVVTLIALAGYVTFSDSPISVRARAVFGVDDRIRPEVQAEGDGTYRFLYTQRGSDRPVGFDPCRSIHYVVNPEHAPDDWEDLVDTAITEVSDRTGLDFEDDGETDDRDFGSRAGSGFKRQPVIIGWADDGEVGGLADDVAGLGGPTLVEFGQLRSFVSGSVVFDSDVTHRYADSRYGEELQLGLLLHELGHLVGLDHVDDSNELMYPRSIGRTTYGPGDVEGLARLGAIPCG